MISVCCSLTDNGKCFADRMNHNCTHLFLLFSGICIALWNLYKIPSFFNLFEFVGLLVIFLKFVIILNSYLLILKISELLFVYFSKDFFAFPKTGFTLLDLNSSLILWRFFSFPSVKYFENTYIAYTDVHALKKL